MINIQPQHVTLSNLIQGRLFRIPEYQRTYSWHQKQRQDLFEDIRRVYTKGDAYSHFMATVVGLRRDAITIMAQEHQVIEIVDGQQRITTLVLLLKAIIKSIDPSDSAQRKIGGNLNDSLVKDDKATLLLLQTNHDSSDYFSNYLRQGTHPPSKNAKTIADRELLSAMEDCERFVADWQGNGNSLIDLIAILNNRLTFVFHEIADEALVYTVFEVLNSRGLEVSWFDRLKSMLMAVVFESGAGNNAEIIDEVHNRWTQIYKRVGLRLGLSTESLRFAATLRNQDRPSRPLGEEAATHLLYSQSADGPYKVIETTRYLQNVTDAVDRLEANGRINAVTRIAHARLVAVAVELNQDFTDAEKIQILDKWENVTFRIYGMYGKDARWMVGDYVRLAWDISNNNLSAAEALKRLSSIGSGFSIAGAVDILRRMDCYNHWRGELRYFLHRYEEYLAKKAGQNFQNEQWNRIWESSLATSIEHIKPQSSWKDDADPSEKHGLGNLTMLPPGLNYKLQDKPPEEKAPCYTKTGLIDARNVAAVISESSDWTICEIRKREDFLLEWASREWAD